MSQDLHGLRSIIDNLPGLAWTCQPDGAVDFFNRHWLAYTGMPNSEALGQGWTKAIHPHDRVGMVAHWQQAIAACKPAEFEARLRRADGEYRWFLNRAHPMFDGQERILKWYGTNTEIEHRHRAEEELSASAEAYRIILDSVPGLLFTTTPSGEVEFVNRTLLSYFCRSLDELQGWKQSDSVHPDDLAHTIREWSKALETGQPCSIEQRLRRFDGTYRLFLFHAVPQHGSDGRIGRWFGTLTDLEDLRRAEGELAAMNARLARASQLAAVSELSAAIAHEVNQPLTAVIANSDACRRWLNMQPPNLERATLGMHHIARDAQAAADIVIRVRSLFRRAEAVRMPLDLNQVVEEVLALLARELNGLGVVVERQLDGHLPAVAADRVQIQQVLVNLVRNAMDAVSDLADGQRVLSVTSQHDGSEITLTVSDSGVGLPEGANVFEAFYTTKSSGMGMGLSITRAIVEAHSGRIWAEANPAGRGATFKVALRARSSD